MHKFSLETAGANDSAYPVLTTAAMKSRVVGPGRTASVTEHVWYITWGATSTVGAVVIETAPAEDYTGTWTPVAAELVWSAAAKTDVVRYNGVLAATRVRCTTTTDGGGVTVRHAGAR